MFQLVRKMKNKKIRFRSGTLSKLKPEMRLLYLSSAPPGPPAHSSPILLPWDQYVSHLEEKTGLIH